MKPRLKPSSLQWLDFCILTGVVSVVNDDMGSYYIIKSPNRSPITITVFSSVDDFGQIYAHYVVAVDNITVNQEWRIIMETKRNEVIQTDQADDVENSIRLCSAKIQIQEQEAFNFHMIKNINVPTQG